MAKEKFNYERIEWIPPAWAAEEGTEDTVIAYSILPKESIYIFLRQRPPREVEIGQRYNYYVGPFGQITDREPKSGKYEHRTGTRRLPPEWYREIRSSDGTRVLSKNRLIAEEAYVEWLDADQKIPFELAFPDMPELQKMSRENPMTSNSKVAERFARGVHGRSENMRSEGDKLFSFNTIIMQRLPGGKVIYNETPYSQTTGGHQGEALHAITPDYIVYGVPFGEHDLEHYLTDQPKDLLATSQVRNEKVDLVRVGGTYYLEHYRPGRTWVDKLSARQAIIEFRDADRRLITDAQAAFPGIGQGKIARYSSNPALGKRHFHLPFDRWHYATTRLLAQSDITNRNRQHEIVNLYQTTNGKYFLEFIGVDKNRQPLWGRIRYITRLQAMNEFRDADRRMLKYEQVF